MHKDAIRYKDVLVLKGSELWNLLTLAAAAKDPKVSRELRNKAEKCYSDTCAKHERLMKGA